MEKKKTMGIFIEIQIKEILLKDRLVLVLFLIISFPDFSNNLAIRLEFIYLRVHLENGDLFYLHIYLPNSFNHLVAHLLGAAKVDSGLFVKDKIID